MKNIFNTLRYSEKLPTLFFLLSRYKFLSIALATVVNFNAEKRGEKKLKIRKAKGFKYIYIITLFLLFIAHPSFAQKDSINPKKYHTIYGHEKDSVKAGIKHLSNNKRDTSYVSAFKKHKNKVRYHKLHFNHLKEYESGLFELKLNRDNIHEFFDDVSKKSKTNFTLIGNTDIVITTQIESFSLDFLVDELCYQNGMLAIKEHNRYIIYGLNAKEIIEESKIIYHYHPRNMGAKELQEKVMNLEMEAKLFLLENDNNILVSGNLTDVKSTIVKLRTLDKKPTKINLELLVVSYNHGKNFRWGFDVTSGKVSRLNNIKYSPNSSDNSVSFDYNFLDNLKPNFKLNLQALIKNQFANIVTNPHVVTLNNQEATINIKENRNIILRTSTINGVTTTLQEYHAGIELKVTPKIMSNSLIELDLDVHHSFFLPEEGDGDVNTQTNDLTTNVVVRNGETLIIGGLIQAEESDGREGIPVLKDIPLLGFLFKRKSKTKVYSETVIYITPYMAPLKNETIIHAANKSIKLIKELKKEGNKLEKKGNRKTF